MGHSLSKSTLLVVSTAAMAIALSGCASNVRWLAERQDSSILNPATVQQPRKKETKTISDSPYSTNKPADKLRGNLEFNSSNIATNCNDSTKTFLCIQELSSKEPKSNDRATEYLNVGIALSNELCANWFEHIYIAQTSLKQTGDVLSATGSLASTMLGVFKADSETVSATAALFGFGKQSADTLNANYVVAADLPTVTSAVTEYRADYADELTNAVKPWNYYTARRAIMAYDNTCSALAVKRFVNFRVSGVEPTEVKLPVTEESIIKSLVESVLEAKRIESLASNGTSNVVRPEAVTPPPATSPLLPLTAIPSANRRPLDKAPTP